MDIKELKKMLKNSTSVLIIEDGEPGFVMMDYELYKNAVLDRPEAKEVKITNSTPAQQVLDTREAEILDKLNKEILALQAQIEEEEKKQGLR